ISLSNVQSGASNSLSDCQAEASAFRTTISYTASNITATAGRKLSVVCRNATGVIKIRI
ncbi:unnamed protein product, partial [Adineta steineri]